MTVSLNKGRVIIDATSDEAQALFEFALDDIYRKYQDIRARDARHGISTAKHFVNELDHSYGNTIDVQLIAEGGN